MTSDTHPLRILLAEDEPLLVMVLEETLIDAGYAVVVAEDLAACMALAESETVDAAVLDINLGKDLSFPAARVLRTRGIPFLFSSGMNDGGVPDDLREQAILQKPYDRHRLVDALDQLTA